MRLALVLVGLALVGCNHFTSGDDDPNEPEFPDEVWDLEPPMPCSVDNVTGTIPGVSISISSPDCRIERGKSTTVTYRVTTTAAVPAIDIPDSQSCSCNHRSTQIDSWLSWVIAGQSNSGDSQQYCLCDTGCCAPQDATTITPEVGMFEDTIEWNGRTWQGPSDFGNQPGDYFLVGTYGAIVRFHGYDEGFVEATLPLEVIPAP